MDTNLNDMWRARGKGYRDEFQSHSWLVNRRFRKQEKDVAKIFSKFSVSSFLEIGCGFGRITKILTDAFPLADYDAFDLSDDQIANARRYVSDKANFSVANILDYSSLKRYDVVCAFEVFMHISPDQISGVIKKAVEASQRYIVNLDWCCKSEPRETGGYCFQHDYPKIYRAAGVNFVETVELKDHWLAKFFPDLRIRQKLFIAEKKESS